MNNTSVKEYERRYQKLISPFSIAYLEGSDWYIGPSFKQYIHNESIYKIIPNKLKTICKILDNIT